MALGDRQRAHNAQQADLRFEQGNVNLRAQAQRAAANNPGINSAIFDDIANQTIQANIEIRNQAALVNQPTASGLPPDPRAAGMAMRQMRAQQMAGIQQNIRNRYGEEGELAWRAMKKETSSPGLLTGFFKMFYDSDKGGLQLGGIVGALLGGGMAYMLTGGGGEGGWLGIAAMVIAPIAGAVLGNRAMDAMDRSSNSGPTFPGRGQAPGHNRGTGVAQNQQPVSNVNLDGTDLASNISGGANVPDQNSGRLPPQIPGGTVQPNGFAMPPVGNGRT